MPAKTPANNKARNATAFKKARAAMLAADPTCAICGREGNTIDHIRPVDTFPNPLDANYPDNYRVLCRSCNSREGARYGNAKRGHTTQSDQDFLGRPSRFTPQDSVSLSKPMNTRVSDGSVQKGRQYPRLRVNTDGGDRVLLGDLVLFAREALGIELQEWQQVVLGDQLALKADGSPMFRRSLVSVARRQGKTVALKCLVAWWLVRMPVLRGKPQVVLTTAHKLDLASDLFRELGPILEEDFGAVLTKSYGRQEARMPDGSRWVARAAMPGIGHGLGIDLCVIDEIWNVAPVVVNDALIPTMRGRPGALLSCWSTAGTSDSEVMIGMRERGIADVSTGRQGSFYFAEFSPPPDVDPLTPEAWYWSNPRLGVDLSVDELVEEMREARKPDEKSAFIRGTANVWTQSASSWLEPGMWENLGDLTVPPDVAGTLAIEASQDDSQFVGVRAATVDGQVQVTVEFVVPTLRELWAAVDQARTRHRGIRLAVAGSLDLHLPPALKGKVTIVGIREIQRWTTLVLGMIRQGQIHHTNEPVLVEQVTNAVLSKHGGQLAVSTARSRGPIELCRAMIWAAALEGKPQAKVSAAMGFSK